MNIYIVEKWFDAFTYEGILGVFPAMELAESAIKQALSSEEYMNFFKIYKADSVGGKPEFVKTY